MNSALIKNGAENLTLFTRARDSESNWKHFVSFSRGSQSSISSRTPKLCLLKRNLFYWNFGIHPVQIFASSDFRPKRKLAVCWAVFMQPCLPRRFTRSSWHKFTNTSLAEYSVLQVQTNQSVVFSGGKLWPFQPFCLRHFGPRRNAVIP